MKNSRSTVVLAEYVGPLLASSSQSIGHNVPQPFQDTSFGLNKLPESRVTVANGGFQGNLQIKDRLRTKCYVPSKTTTANCQNKEFSPSRYSEYKSHLQKKSSQDKMRKPESLQE